MKALDKTQAIAEAMNASLENKNEEFVVFSLDGIRWYYIYYANYTYGDTYVDSSYINGEQVDFPWYS